MCVAEGYPGPWMAPAKAPMDGSSVPDAAHTHLRREPKLHSTDTEPKLHSTDTEPKLHSTDTNPKLKRPAYSSSIR